MLAIASGTKLDRNRPPRALSLLSMHIELNRTFRELLRNEERGDEVGALSPGPSTLTLSELLAARRVVILSDAGSGKTQEILEAARRLRREGKPAFFLRLENVAFDFDSAFEEGSLEEFQKWVEGSDEGWVLLDSIDESRLRSPLDFDRALRTVSGRLSPAKQRTHLILTGRPAAWRPRTDLALCEKLFPAGSGRALSPPDDEVSPESYRVGQRPSPAASFTIVGMEELSAAQVRRFALGRQISDTDAFIDAIERADALSFTARPHDLEELAALWRETGVIGSRRDLMENSVKRRLKEPTQTRAEAWPLPLEKARDGVQRIAAALMLTNHQSIWVPDGDETIRGVSCLRLDGLMPDWDAKELATLLGRPLFAHDVYGTVRFHHRSVKEYLAAQWFLDLLKHERSRREVEGLFFREQYGLEVVTPSLRPLLPWIAMADNRVLARVRRVAPEIVFEGGDPVQLPVDVRIDILESVCRQLASGSSTRSMADYAAIQRFAAPDLSHKLRSLIMQYQGEDEVIVFLMRMVWQGRLSGALQEALAIGQSSSVGAAARIAAFRVVADLGEAGDLARVRDHFLAEPGVLSRDCMAELVSHLRTPAADTLQWLLACIPRLPEPDEFHDTGLSTEVAEFFERAPLAVVIAAVDRIHGLITEPPVRPRYDGGLSLRYRWLSEAALAIVRRLASVRDPSALTPASLGLLYLLPLDGRYNPGTDSEDAVLCDLVGGWTELKWALFWYSVAQERTATPAPSTPAALARMALYNAPYVRVDESDFNEAILAIGARETSDDKMVALSLACVLAAGGQQDPLRRDMLHAAVADSGQLEAYLRDLLSPLSKSPEIEEQERLVAEHDRRRQRRMQREDRARSALRARLEANLDALRSPAFADRSTLSVGQHYLFDRMCELSEGRRGGRRAHLDWKVLEAEFGVDVSRAFRDGIVGFWRGHSPRLLSEGAQPNSIPGADLFGLAGLSIEASETPGLFGVLTEAEAATAFRYAMRELNGFPSWFHSLWAAYPRVVATMALNEIAFETREEGAGAPNSCGIYRFSRYGDSLWNVLGPALLDLLREHPPRHLERLTYLLDIVQSSDLSDAAIAGLAAERWQSVADNDQLPLWAAVWTGTAPDAAIEAVERHLAALGDSQARTTFAMSFVTLLVGSRFKTTRVRTRFCAPEFLGRLYLLVHEYVRAGDDIDRANKGVYSPGPRDYAQDARERLVALLQQIPGRDSFLALRRISELHPDPRLRPWFVLQARARAEADCEPSPWSAEQVWQFGSGFERVPANHRELFDLAVMRLLDLKHEQEEGDDSMASVLIRATLETEIRNFVAAWCNHRSCDRYQVTQEEELPDAKRPDLRWRGKSFDGPVPVELKIADKWSGPELFERLECQLAGDYLRDLKSNRGIYLLVNRGTRARWDLPAGGRASFEELICALQAHWTSVASAHSGVEEIRVIGIDLTKRAQAPLRSRKARKRAAAN